MHDNHKIIEINDEEALKKESITIENSKNEFDINIKKLENLKNIIEKEMKEIDDTYEKVDKETSKSYEIKREKLNKEENDLKEKLKTEVTKIKEKYELSLTEINNIIKSYNKIIKGINILEKEEKNMIKTISYISKININKEKMRILFQELMKNLKITYIENESSIKYEEYYFNGIPSPINIEFNNVSTNSFNISWKLDDINLLNINKNEIKYRIEIRKENKKEKFKIIYEDKNNNYLVNNLDKNTNYEIRLCSIYNDIISNYIQIYKIKTNNFLDSIILNENERGNEYLNKLYEWTGYKEMELIYRGTRDGSGSNIFHNKCDNKGPNIRLIKNDKGNIFGGYSSISWTSDNNNHSANDSFLFTLTNIYGTSPTKYPNTQKRDCAVYHYSKNGPIFGSGFDLCISDNYLNNNNSYSSLAGAYPDVLGKGNSIFSGHVNTNKIKIKELEVFKLK